MNRIESKPKSKADECDEKEMARQYQHVSSHDVVLAKAVSSIGEGYFKWQFPLKQQFTIPPKSAIFSEHPNVKMGEKVVVLVGKSVQTEDLPENSRIRELFRKAKFVLELPSIQALISPNFLTSNYPGIESMPYDKVLMLDQMCDKSMDAVYESLSPFQGNSSAEIDAEASEILKEGLANCREFCVVIAAMMMKIFPELSFEIRQMIRGDHSYITVYDRQVNSKDQIGLNLCGWSKLIAPEEYQHSAYRGTVISEYSLLENPKKSVVVHVPVVEKTDDQEVDCYFRYEPSQVVHPS